MLHLSNLPPRSQNSNRVNGGCLKLLTLDKRTKGGGALGGESLGWDIRLDPLGGALVSLVSSLLGLKSAALLPAVFHTPTGSF